MLASRSVLLIDANETNKSLHRIPDYVEHLVSHQLRRDHVLVAVGGGTIQDITSFLAATMLRGVAWEFYPSTLLAQADSCIGSKSSINSGAAKNILGTFTPPRKIVVYRDFLKTLSERDLRSGIGEILKVHIIDGPETFDIVAENVETLMTSDSFLETCMMRALEIKKQYIEKDEFDRGPRNNFNYGHTFGHAIESASGFNIPHGIAVAMGMDLANWVSAGLHVGSRDNFEKMHTALQQVFYDFVDFPLSLADILLALSKDKKNVGKNSVTLILPDTEARIFKDAYPMDETFSSLCQQYFNGVRSRK